MGKRVLFSLERHRLPHHVGAKARNLQALAKQGFTIPITYAISWHMQEVVTENGGHFPAAFVADLERVVRADRDYAVRSSAAIEDSSDHSFAGQFLTRLDVQGVDAILAAIKAVWSSTDDERPSSYSQQKGVGNEQIHMGILLQEMVPAVLSGVAFSHNPITMFDEVVIEAVEGSGVNLVQGGVTPRRWIWKWGKWIQRPDGDDSNEVLIGWIAEQVKDIGERRKQPVDVEWVYDGEQVYWLQVRNVTVRNDINIYANHISKEFMPGLIKPLVWSVNVPLVNGAWIWLLAELIGQNDLDPLRLSRKVYGRAYFNMGLLGSVFKQIGLPSNALERLMGFEAERGKGPVFRPSWKAIRYLPRMIAFFLDKLRFEKRLMKYMEDAEARYEELSKAMAEERLASNLLLRIQELYSLNQQTAYFNIVTPLLMQSYHLAARRRLARAGIEVERMNWLEGWDDREIYDPAPSCRRLGGLYRRLSSSQIEEIATAVNTTGQLPDFQESFRRFMTRFGHFSDSGNDFSYPAWRESPDLVLDLIARFAEDPRLDEAGSPEREILSKARGFFVKRAIRFSRYREQISFLYTYGFSLFREAYLQLGADFSKRGWLSSSKDIFFLEHAEIEGALQANSEEDALKKLVAERKEKYQSYDKVIPPALIFGDRPPAIADSQGAILKGTPTSRGRYRGRVRVVKGIKDFTRVTDGCVLVIPFSDVSWSPLFARAGAVVAESGGMLSHSSIVAREYGVPAIVSVPNACQLEDDLEVTVDGFSGEVILHDRI